MIKRFIAVELKKTEGRTVDNQSTQCPHIIERSMKEKEKAISVLETLTAIAPSFTFR